MSDPQSLSLLDLRKDITAIYLHPVNKMLQGEQPVNSAHHFKMPKQVDDILTGINFAKPANTTGLASIINARLFFIVGGKTEEFVVLGGYQFIAKKTDRNQSYSLSPQLSNTFRSLIERQDFLNA